MLYNVHKTILLTVFVLFSAEISAQTVSYLWSNGATTPNILVNPQETTTYYVTITQDGVDYFDSLVVTVTPPPVVAINGNTSICLGYSTTLQAEQGSSYLWSTGETSASITVSPFVSTTYLVEVIDTNGCRGAAEVNVFVNQPSTFSETVSICNSYLWKGNSYTQSGTYTVTYTNAAGCDSIEALNLIINQPSASTINATISEGEIYSFYGQNLTAEGTYTATLQNAAGCDSVVTLILDVNLPINCEIITNTSEICFGQTLDLNIAHANNNLTACLSSQLPAPLNLGLAAYFPFCGNANDMSDNGNDAIINGASLAADRFGNENSAFSFDGNDDFLIIETGSVSNLSSLNDLTISCWVKFDTNNTHSDQGFVTKWNQTGYCGELIAPSYWLGYHGAGSKIIGATSNNGDPFTCVGASNEPHNAWHHLVYTHDNSGEKFYFDGILSGQASFNQTFCSSSNPLVIGADFNSGEIFRFFNGQIDDIFIYNRAVSQQEVNLLYGDNQSILWSTGETTPSISVTPTETTTYNVTVSQGNQSCTSEVTIIVNQPSASTLDASIIEGESYSFDGQNLTTAGTYSATYLNAAGCDSVVTLNLSVNPAPSGCFATTFSNFVQGTTANGLNVAAIRSNPEQALNQPETVVDGVVNFVSLGFGGSITLAFETPVANGAGDDIRIDEATWGNNPCNRYPERADVFASQDGSNYVYLGQVCQDATLDLGVLSWAQFIRIVDASDLLSFNADADGFDVNGIECLNGPATVTSDDGLVGCNLQNIVSYTPGTRKNGTPVATNRSDASKALGTPQNNNTINFVALGFGGTLVAKFDYVVFNQAGNDLRVTETSFGNPSCTNYPEKARISVSLDNVNWVELGELCQDGEVDLGTLPYAQYIKIQDASPLSSSRFNGTADGYDVDAVVVLNNGCGANARFAEEAVIEETLDFNVYPNPIEAYAIVSLSDLDRETEFELALIDAAGRIVMQKQVLIGNEGYTLFVSDLARGIYTLTLSNAEQHFVKRLVK
jgi:hypothetical protein